ncbi:MAG TPA: amidohydrolase [Saprospiraceae bacterium]|nr:amidohydrolase [Saprospiraceae bacterium]HMQ85313.1 amidohydrolase [Saprospiraceae bacterium]
MNTLHVRLLQTDLVWENPNANHQHIQALLEATPSSCDLIVLPEMFSTGFSMNPINVAEEMGGTSMQWMADQANKYQSVVVGSLVIHAQGQYYNRLIWMSADGTYQYYDKKHLFAMAGEADHYQAGKQQLLVELKGWKVMPLICYDLRFPVWSRNTMDYDLLLYVANWPDKRKMHWQTLLAARAIENQAYTIGLNRCGSDANGLYYSGDTAVYDYGGELLGRISHQEGILDLKLNKAAQQDYRNKLPFLQDRDNFSF